MRYCIYCACSCLTGLPLTYSPKGGNLHARRYYYPRGYRNRSRQSNDCYIEAARRSHYETVLPGRMGNPIDSLPYGQAVLTHAKAVEDYWRKLFGGKAWASSGMKRSVASAYTEQEARYIAKEYNRTHAPGRLCQRARYIQVDSMDDYYAHHRTKPKPWRRFFNLWKGSS